MLLSFPVWQTWPEAVQTTTYIEAKQESLTSSQMRRIIADRGVELKNEMESMFAINGNSAHREGVSRIIRTFKYLGDDIPYPESFGELGKTMMLIYLEGVEREKPVDEVYSEREMLDLIDVRQGRIANLLDEIQLGVHNADASIGGSHERIALNSSSLRANMEYIDNIISEDYDMPRTEMELNLACMMSRMIEGSNFRTIFGFPNNMLHNLTTSTLLLNITK